MKVETKENVRRIMIILCAVFIPVLLLANGIQAHRYEALMDEIVSLEQKQTDLVEDNSRLITNISLLSSAERIQKLAETELGMHKAASSEIVRVEMEGSTK